MTSENEMLKLAGGDLSTDLTGRAITTDTLCHVPCCGLYDAEQYSDEHNKEKIISSMLTACGSEAS